MSRNGTLSPCPPDRIAELVALLDAEFILPKNRPPSLAVRFPETFTPANAGNLFIARESDRIVAAAASRPFEWRDAGKNFSAAMIGSVWTAPDRRGRGWGKAIMKYAEAHWLSQGAELLMLWTEIPDFYERMGWNFYDDGAILGEVAKKDFGLPAERVLEGAPRDLADHIEDFRKGEGIQRAWEDYARIPLPAAKTKALVIPGSGYALIGETTDAIFIFEMKGSLSILEGLLGYLTRYSKRILINDFRDSFSGRTLAEDSRIAWAPKKLTMTKLISETAGERIIRATIWDRI